MGLRVCPTPSLPAEATTLEVSLSSRTPAGGDSLTENRTGSASGAEQRARPRPPGRAPGRPRPSPTPVAWSSRRSYADSAPSPPRLLSNPITGVRGGRPEVEPRGRVNGERERTQTVRFARARTPSGKTPGARTPHPSAHAHRRAQLPTFKAKRLQDGRKEGGGVAGRPGVTGSDVQRAEDASRTAKVRKSETPFSIPKSGLPCLQPRSPSSQRGSGGGEGSQSRASPRLPSPAWPRARNSAPSSRGLGRLPGEERLAKGLWGSKRAGREHFARSGRAAHCFLCRHTSSEPPSPTFHAHRYRDTHAFALPTIPGASIKTLVDFFLIKKKKKKSAATLLRSRQSKESPSADVFHHFARS